MPWNGEMLGRWTLATSTESYLFAVNPKEANVPAFTKKLTAMTTTAGATVVVEGNPDPPQFTFSGTLLESDQFDAMQRWTSDPVLNRPITLTDHYMRQWVVMIRSFEPTMTPTRPQFPYKHTWQMTAVVISGPVYL
jgi:hypothetical protein